MTETENATGVLEGQRTALCAPAASLVYRRAQETCQSMLCPSRLTCAVVLCAPMRYLLVEYKYKWD